MSVPHGIDRSGAAGGTGAQGMIGSLNDLTDPNADRILFWDDSAGDLDWLSLGTGLSITGTSMALHANLVTLLGLSTADGNFIVGDGSTWVVESGATARASLGIPAVQSPDAVGDFVIGETASNPISVPFPLGGSPLINGKVSLSVAASALTITVLGHDGVALSASNPLFVRMPQGNPLDGTYTLRKATSNLTLTVSLGSTLGTINGSTTPIYVYLLDNSGVVELAVSGTYYGAQSVRSTTAEGGAGGADSVTVIYSTSARTSVPIVPILKWDCAQTSAGVWLSITGEKKLAPGEVIQNLTLATEQVTNSGTAIDFTNIPAGVRKITVQFLSVSTNGTSNIALQLGDINGIQTSGYLGGVGDRTDETIYSSGLLITSGMGSTLLLSGAAILTLENSPSNHWTVVGTVGRGDAAGVFFFGGHKAVIGVLNQIRLTTISGSDTFDNGLINILYEY